MARLFLPAIILVVSIYLGGLVSCGAAPNTTGSGTPLATIPVTMLTGTTAGTATTHAFASISGLPAPRWLTETEKQDVINVAMEQDEVTALTSSLGLSRTDIDWVSLRWLGDYVEAGTFPYEETDNLSFRHEGYEYYSQVTLYFGSPERLLLRIAVNPETGEIAQSPRFNLKPLPTAPVSTPLPQEILARACPYTVVEEQLGTTIEDPGRTTARWSITAAEADSYEKFVGTVMQAAIDLYKLHGRDFTTVVLVPAPGIYVNIAQASFSSDGRGAEGMTGSVPANPAWWTIRAADRTMTERELAIARLWFDHMKDFPAKNWFSSLSYDEEGLKQFISDELGIPADEIGYPGPYFIEHQEMYIAGQEFIDWTLEQRNGSSG